MIDREFYRIIPDVEDEAGEIFEGSALDYLQGVYRGRLRFDAHRFRAANAALAFESPKLAVANIIHHEGDLADRLMRAIERSQNGGRLIEAKTIEHSASELRPECTSADERRRFMAKRRMP
jgi:hypothetical protein